MPALPYGAHRRADGARGVEGLEEYFAEVALIIEKLEEDAALPAPFDRKRIRRKGSCLIRHDPPGWPGQRAVFDDARAIDVTPPDAPVRRAHAEPVDQSQAAVNDVAREKGRRMARIPVGGRRGRRGPCGGIGKGLFDEKAHAGIDGLEAARQSVGRLHGRNALRDDCAGRGVLHGKRRRGAGEKRGDGGLIGRMAVIEWPQHAGGGCRRNIADKIDDDIGAGVQCGRRG